MKQLKEHIKFILENGTRKPGRSGSFETGDASISVFSRQLRFNLAEGLPFTTSKRLQILSMLKETCWFLRGETNTKTLGCSIWDKWSVDKDLGVQYPIPESELIANLQKLDQFKDLTDVQCSEYLLNLQRKYAYRDDGKLFNRDELTVTNFQTDPNLKCDYDSLDKELNDLGIETKFIHVFIHKGDCGPIYGEQWRRFTGINKYQGNDYTRVVDQLMYCYDQLANSKHSRRILVDSWNPAQLPESGITIEQNITMGKMGLPPCHMLFQFYVVDGVNRENGKDQLHLNLRLRSSDTGLGLPFNVGGYSIINHLFAEEFQMDVGELITDIGDAHIYLDHVEPLKHYLECEEHPLPTFSMPDYEERKRKFVSGKLVEELASKPDDVNLQMLAYQYFGITEGIDPDIIESNTPLDQTTPEYKRDLFMFLLDNIDHTFFDGAILNYVSEPDIKMNLHD